MKKKLNPALIGAFIIGALAIAIAAVLYYGKGQFSGEKSNFVAYFRSQANGLVVGSPVVMQGVPIGNVEAIQIGYSEEDSSFFVLTHLVITGGMVDWPESVQAEIDHDREKLMPNLIGRGLRARLATQSLLTGRLMVELGFFPDTEAVLRGDEWEIPTILTPIEQISDTLKRINFDKMAASIETAVSGLDSVVNGLNELVNNPKIDDIGDELLAALKNANNTLDVISAEIGPTAKNLNESLGAVKQLANSLDGRVGGIADTIEKTGDEIGNLVGHADQQIAALAGDLRGVVDSAEKTMQDAGKAARGASSLLAENSPLHSELVKTLRNLSDAARSLKGFADYMERHPEALLKGKK
ncbi:MAG: MlaD family protein [Pseudomonadota bacterium]|nr:MlaD family protein [Pseudomonadota bacterium]